MDVEEGICDLGSEGRQKGIKWGCGKPLPMSALQNWRAPWWVFLLIFTFIPPSLPHSMLLSSSSGALSSAASGRCCRSCQLCLAFHLAEKGKTLSVYILTLCLNALLPKLNSKTWCLILTLSYRTIFETKKQRGDRKTGRSKHLVKSY